MILGFANKGTEDIFNGVDSRAARKVCPRELWSVAYRKLEMIQAATIVRDLSSPPGNRPEPLKGDRKGQHAIRINRQYRICFVWSSEGADNVGITDYH